LLNLLCEIGELDWREDFNSKQFTMCVIVGQKGIFDDFRGLLHGPVLEAKIRCL